MNAPAGASCGFSPNFAFYFVDTADHLSSPRALGNLLSELPVVHFGYRSSAARGNIFRFTY